MQQASENTFCDNKTKYEKLVRQHERAGDQLRTVSRNLELVTRQLVARDMMHYMDTVSHLFKPVGESLYSYPIVSILHKAL